MSAPGSAYDRTAARCDEDGAWSRVVVERVEVLGTSTDYRTHARGIVYRDAGGLLRVCTPSHFAMAFVPAPEIQEPPQ